METRNKPNNLSQLVESEMLAKYASASLSFAFPFDRLTYFVKPVSCFMVTKHLEADYHITLNHDE